MWLSLNVKALKMERHGSKPPCHLILTPHWNSIPVTLRFSRRIEWRDVQRWPMCSSSQLEHIKSTGFLDFLYFSGEVLHWISIFKMIVSWCSRETWLPRTSSLPWPPSAEWVAFFLHWYLEVKQERELQQNSLVLTSRADISGGGTSCDNHACGS